MTIIDKLVYQLNIEFNLNWDKDNFFFVGSGYGANIL